MMSTPTPSLITLTHPQSKAAEAYHQLGTAIRIGVGSGCLLAARPTPKETLGQLVANLGIVLAQGGCRVILVDADLRYPELHLLLGTPLSPGFADSLNGPFWAIRNTFIPNLRLLPAGSAALNPAVLLASPNLARMLNDLKAQADYLLLTSPPALAVADATLLAPHVDGVLIVIKPGVTKRSQARETQSLLARVNAKILGVVLSHEP